MGYQRSGALDEFEGRMRELTRVASISNRKALKPYSVGDHLLCASLFLSFSQFEAYIRDFISELLLAIQNKSPVSSKLPGLIAAAHLYSALDHDPFRRYYAMSNHREFYGALRNMAQANRFVWADPLHKGTLSGDSVQQGITYPKPENINSVFFRLGINNILGQVNARLRTDSKLKLDSINSVRVSMAHFGMPTGMSREDVLEMLDDLLQIARALDRIATSEISRYCRKLR